jgi:hypothetical protein
MKSQAAIRGLSFAFCFCNLLARVYKVRPFVLGAQPLDTSPLGLCWHNKTLLSAKLPQCPESQLKIPATFWGGLFAGIAETVIFYFPCHWGASPTAGRSDPTRHPWTVWSRGGTHLPGKLG